MQNLIINPNLNSNALIELARRILFGLKYNIKDYLNADEKLEYYTISDKNENEYNLPFYVHTKREVSDYVQWEDEIDFITDELEITAVALIVPVDMSDADLEFEVEAVKDEILKKIPSDEKEIAEIYITI